MLRRVEYNVRQTIIWQCEDRTECSLRWDVFHVWGQAFTPRFNCTSVFNLVEKKLRL